MAGEISDPMVYVYLVIIHFLIGAILVVLMLVSYKACKQCAESALAYHDFLIDYRATPRSKMLRKHLPSLDAVVEE